MCIISNNFANKYVACANLKVSKAKSYSTLNQMHLSLIRYNSKKNRLMLWVWSVWNIEKLYYRFSFGKWLRHFLRVWYVYEAYILSLFNAQMLIISRVSYVIISIFRFQSYLLLILQYLKSNHSIYFFRKFALNAGSIFTLNFDITLMATRGYIMGNEL